jgi:hypothetical protein
MPSGFRHRGEPSSFSSNVRQAGRSEIVIIYSISQGILVCEWKEQLPLGGRRRTTQERQPALRRDGEGGGTRERTLPKHDRRELRASVAASVRFQPDSACVTLEEIVHPAFGRCRLDPQENASSSDAVLHFGTGASEEDDRRLGVVEGADSAERGECGWIASVRRGGQENSSPRSRGDGMRCGTAIARA